MKRKIALLFGGRGDEHAISCRSAAAIWQAIEDEVTLYPIAIDKNGECFLYFGEREALLHGSFDRASAIPAALTQEYGRGGIRSARSFVSIDVAIPALHGNFGEDGIVQGHLCAVGIPFVGTPTLGGAVSNDKALTKMLATAIGVPTLRGCLISVSLSLNEVKQSAVSVIGDYPYFIKPNSRGSSIGASTATDDESLRHALQVAAPYGEILIEPYLSHPRELEIGLLEVEGQIRLTDIGEIRYTSGFYDFDAKYQSLRAAINPHAEIRQEHRDAIVRHTHALARLLGIRDLARFDYFLTEDGRLYFNEINPFPGFTEDSLYPILVKDIGFDYKTLLSTLIDNAYARGI